MQKPEILFMTIKIKIVLAFHYVENRLGYVSQWRSITQMG